MITRAYTRRIGGTEGMVALLPPQGTSEPTIAISLGDCTVVQISRAEAEDVVSYLQRLTAPDVHTGPDVQIPLGRHGIWMVLDAARAYRLRVALAAVVGHAAAADIAEAANG